MTIGIPRALYSYYHFPLWRQFAGELHVDVVLSPPTDRGILVAGVKVAPPEICLPVKAYLGHVAWLRGRCDAIMIHRMVCVKEGGRVRFGCPKAMCLPDLVRATVPGLPEIIEVTQDERSLPARKTYLKLAWVLTGRDHAGPAWAKARQEQTRVDDLIRSGLPMSDVWEQGTWKAAPRASGAQDPVSHSYAQMGTDSDSQYPGTSVLIRGSIPDNPRPRIGVVGHPYLVFDRALGLGLPEKLNALGVEACYTSAVSDLDAFPEPLRYREMHWLYETELLNGAWQFLSRNGRPHQVDGLLLVSSFACGTSAVINEVIMREMAHPDIPVSTVVLDEHTAEAGLATRLEAFVDLVRHRRAGVC